MNVYISIISHGHEDYIIENSWIRKINHVDNYHVVIKDNKSSLILKEYCKKHSLIYLSDGKTSGFSRNNNLIYEFCKNELGLIGSDYFMVINPDIIIEVNQIQALIEYLVTVKIPLAAIPLYKDRDFNKIEYSARCFPRLLDFIQSFFLGKNKTIYQFPADGEDMLADWASGAFLVFNANLYNQLQGFDESYFMYCEDIDICLRAKYLLGINLLYISRFKAVHLAQYNNRKVFSRHFYWHVISVVRYLKKKKSIVAMHRRVSPQVVK